MNQFVDPQKKEQKYFYDEAFVPVLESQHRPDLPSSGPAFLHVPKEEVEYLKQNWHLKLYKCL